MKAEPKKTPSSTGTTKPRKARTATAPGAIQSGYPTVAFVGRPNVGKSSIFNALLKQELSITDARAGTTRDRVLHPTIIDGKPCDLMDTGGIGIVDKYQLTAEIESQIQKAIHAATMLVHVVDAQEGLTPLDREVSARLRRLNVPMILAANKTEGKEAKVTLSEFSELGIQPIVSVSALHRQGLDDLEDAIAAHLPAGEVRDDYEDLPRIAVVGRRNVGKSSFCNALAHQERTIVSAIPGTTRDSVDVMLEKDNQKFLLVDTAGLRRMKEPEGPVEFFSQVRTERALRRCDVVILMLASREGVSTTDRKLCDQITEECKPVLIVVNKWDESKGVQTGDYLKYLEQRLPALRHSPVAFTSAITGTRCWQAMDVALELFNLSNQKIPTPKLNKAIERAEFEHEPPASKGFKPRLLYGVQVAKRPPTIVINCRHSDKIDKRYNRYLQNRLREILEMEEVPIRIFLRDAPR